MTSPIITNQIQDKQEANPFFIELLDSSAKYFTFQTFDDNKDRKDKRLGRKNCNIIRARAIFQDDDDGFEGTYPSTPSIEVEASPGKYQRYWLSSELTPDQFNTLLDRLVHNYGCDKNAKGLAKVFRLPGFLHLKNPAQPHLVTLLQPSPGTVYGAEALISAFLGDDEESSGDVEGSDVGDVAKEACSSLSEKCTLVPGESEKKRIVSALQALPQRFVDERSLWRDIGMALYSSGLEDARELFDEWSMGSRSAVGRMASWVQPSSMKPNRTSSGIALGRNTRDPRLPLRPCSTTPVGTAGLTPNETIATRTWAMRSAL